MTTRTTRFLVGGLALATIGSAAVGVTQASAASPASWSQGEARVFYAGGVDLPGDKKEALPANANVSSVEVPGSRDRTVFATAQLNEDVGKANPVTRLKISTDGGKTFPAAVAKQDSPFYATTRLANGSLIDIGFIPDSMDANRTTVHLRAKTSNDNGRTWTDLPSTLRSNSGHAYAMDRGVRINPNILTDKQGNLLLSYYTTIAGKKGNRVEMAKSTDGGRTWNRLAPIIQESADHQYNEAGVSWAPNGDLVAVISQSEHYSKTWRRHTKLVSARSSDGGRTWKDHQVTPISFSKGYAFRPAPDGKVRYGIHPDLELLPNGVMALRFGRPDNWFAISTDGGKTFEQARRTYVNWPKKGFAYHGSSGNGSMAVLNHNQVIISGDNCGPTWGCPPGDSGFTESNRFQTWTKIITVNPPRR